MKLHELLAFERATRKRTQEEITNLLRDSSKAPLVEGVEKRYEPIVEDGLRFNPEIKPVQIRADDAIARFRVAWLEETEIVGRKEMANTSARGRVTLGDESMNIGGEVPATYLLFLEKQLEHVRTFIAKMAELPAGEEWAPDGQTGLHKAPVKLAHRAEKTQEYVTVFAPTDKHPGQANMVERVKVVGTWHTTLVSGGIEPSRKRELLSRIAKLTNAVKAARERANEALVPPADPIADEIMDYIFE